MRIFFGFGFFGFVVIGTLWLCALILLSPFIVTFAIIRFILLIRAAQYVNRQEQIQLQAEQELRMVAYHEQLAAENEEKVQDTFMGGAYL